MLYIRSRPHNVALAHGDLLPIQQLAKLDEDMLRSTTSALPTRLAAKLWNARVDPNGGDNPRKRGQNRSVTTSRRVISNTGFVDKNRV